MTSRGEVRDGGSGVALPVVWVLTDDRPGNTTQAIGLAWALGWPYEVKKLHFTPRAHTIKNRFGPFAATLRGLDLVQSAELRAPWPDVVIAAGWRPAQVARWIRKQSRGRTRTVQLGRKGGHVAGLFDVVVSCSHTRFPPHPRRIEVIAPLTQVSPERLSEAAVRWRALVASARPPYIMVLIGGVTKRHVWNVDVARRFGEEVRDFARSLGGSVFAITSRRTGAEAAAAFAQGLGAGHHVHTWQPEQVDNPYLGYLTLADILIVTGESESMLAEAASVGKRVYIYPLPDRPRRRTLKVFIKDIVVRHAYPDRQGGLGRTAIQFGLEKLCRVLIASGMIRPRRDLHALHQALIRRGVARFFGESFPPGECLPLREVDEVARKVKVLLGYEPPEQPPKDSISVEARG